MSLVLEAVEHQNVAYGLQFGDGWEAAARCAHDGRAQGERRVRDQPVAVRS